MRFSFELSWKNFLFGGFLLIVCLLPLIASAVLFSPPVWGKTIVFRIFVAVLLVGEMWYVFLRNGKKTIEIPAYHNPLFVPILLLFGLAGIFFLSTIFSQDFYMSFWGMPERSWGFLNFLILVSFSFLAFLFLSKRQWDVVWNAALIGGVGVAGLAFAQQFHLQIVDAFIVREGRPVGTLGSPIVLGAYLVLLATIMWTFLLEQRRNIGKFIPYGCIGALFLLIIFFTLSRGAWIGLAIALCFFAFFYPIKKRIIHIGFGIILLFAISAVVLVNTIPASFVQSKPVLSTVWYRLDVEIIAQDPRIVAWQELIKAVGDRPVGGYGAYNSSAGFDRYYQPGFISATGWWDTAHNLFLDILLWAGIPGLLIFLGFMGILLRRLSQVKRQLPLYTLRAHMLQTFFVAYLVTLFFSFDMFPISLLFFLGIGYAFFLISRLPSGKKQFFVFPLLLSPIQYLPLLIGVTLGAAWFIYSYNLVPLFMNKEIVLAVHQAQSGRCDEAFEKMDQMMHTASFFAEYARTRYTDVVATCIEDSSPEAQLALSEKVVDVLSKSAHVRPHSVRVWLLLGGYTNNLIAFSKSDEEKKKLAKNVEEYFQKAEALSPRREEIFWEWMRTYRLIGNEEQVWAKATACIEIQPKRGVCWWERAKINFERGDIPLMKEDIREAETRKYFVEKERLLELLGVYEKLAKGSKGTEFYKNLASVYERIISLDPKNPQYYASLAFVYRELKEYVFAKNAAYKVLEFNPKAEPMVMEFLKTLPQ